MPPIRPVPKSITSLTDQELADQLREYPITLGPILPTTRRVYERKLFQLQTGENASPSSGYEPVDDDDEEEAMDEDSADEEVTIQQKQPRQRSTMTTRPEAQSVRTDARKPSPPSPRKPLHSGMTSTYSRTPSAPAPQQRSQRQTTERPPAKSNLLPLWVKLLAIVIVAALVFLVIKNMESDPASNIPDQIEVNV